MSTMGDHNQILRTSGERVRRAPLDFVGNLLGDVFGVLNQRDAQKYHEQIQGRTKGTLELHKLVQQQTHILDLTTNIMHREKNMMDQQYQLLHKDIQGIMLHEEYMDVFLFKDTQSDRGICHLMCIMGGPMSDCSHRHS